MKSIVLYSVIASLIIIVVKFIVYYANLQLTLMGIFMGIFSLILMIFPLYFAMKTRRDTELGKFMTIRQAMGTGMMFSIITGLITGVFIYIFSAYIDHETTPLILKKIEENMRAAKISQPEINAELIAQKAFYSPFNQALKGGFMSILGVGFILSFISSMFVLRNPPPEN